MTDNVYDYTLKFIIVGESSVGKSNILLQFTDKRFEQAHDVTIGVEFGSKIISCNNTVYNIQIWDTAGQETYKTITKSYYRGAVGCLLVYDITNRDTFDAIPKWLNDIKEINMDMSNMILIGNKIDLEEYRTVSYEEGKKFADDNKMGFIETSAKTGVGIVQSFMNILQCIDTRIKSGELTVSNNNCIKLSADKEHYDYSSYGCYC